MFGAQGQGLCVYTSVISVEASIYKGVAPVGDAVLAFEERYLTRYVITDK